jgi:hypothetical protein
MANTNSPFGLRYLGLNGAPATNSSMQERRNGILYSNSTAIYTGDLIQQSADGYLYQYASGQANYLVYGVFAGCRYASNSQQTVVPQKYWPGTDAASGSVLAQWTPAQLTAPPLFVIQTDATGITLADIGANCDVVVGTGSTTTGFSGAYLDTTTLSTLLTYPLRVVDLWVNYVMGNNPEGAGSSSSLVQGTQSGAYNWAVVAINTIGGRGI